MSGLKIEQADTPFEIDVKRFYLPVTITATCPKCGATVTRDFEEHYLSYPSTNEPIEEMLYCGGKGGCENEWPVSLILRLTLEEAPPVAHG